MSLSVDLTDHIFGKLVVVDRERDPRKIPEQYKHHKVWYCLCECGEPKWATTGHLTKGRVKSCGCSLRKKFVKYDITNQRFGKLTALERSEKIGNKTAWLCRCDCGLHRKVRLAALRKGEITSCGCDKPNKRGRRAYVF